MVTHNDGRNDRTATMWSPEDIASLRDLTDETRDDGALVRRVYIRPEFDCWDSCAHGKDTCKPHTGGWHGIGSRQVVWSVALRGRGAVSLSMFMPICTENALLRGGPGLASLIRDWTPSGAVDLHYVSPPEYLSDYSPSPCMWVEGECWGDCTFLGADPGFEAYREGRTPGVWAWLGEAWLPQVIGVDSGRTGEQ